MSVFPRSRLGRCFGLALLALCTAAPRPAAALDVCVQTLADLTSGLSQAGFPQADGTVTLRLVAQHYVWTHQDFNVLLVNRLNVLGGYNADCTARTVNPANTILDGAGLLQIRLHDFGLGVTVEGVHFKDLEALHLFAGGSCADYGNDNVWRRTIVDGNHAFRLDLNAACGSLHVQNNLVRARYGSTFALVPDPIPVDLFITNNTFINSDQEGVSLFVGEEAGGSRVYFNNNVLWNNAGPDVAVSSVSHAFPDFRAWNNTWALNAVPISEGGENSTANPLLDANGVPAAPGSPAINSGRNNPPGGLPAVDIVGSARLIGSAVDRGAFESSIVDVTELVVTHAGDSGSGSLRQAILDANSLPNFNVIRFAIPGDFGAILIPQSPYPDIVTPMRIDGFTQPGAQPNANQWSNNAKYRITIAGGGQVGYAFRVPTSAPASTKLELRGLLIGGFNNALLLQSGSGHVVRGNHFGKFDPGVLGGSDNLNAIYVNGSADGVTIGGLDPADRNSIAGHQEPSAGNGYGIYLGGIGDGHLVMGNLVGTFPDGNRAHGHQVGIRIDTDLGVVMQNLVSGNVSGIQLHGSENLVVSNRIGVKALAICLPPCVPDYALPNTHGIVAYAGATGNGIWRNQVAYNDYSGLIFYAGTLGNELQANRVHANGTFDLDLREPAGMNPVDYDGLAANCDQANCGRNFPQLEAAFGMRYAGRVQGSLSTANGTYRVEFFSGSTCGPGGQGGASRYLGARDVVVTGGSTLPPRNGHASFDVPIESVASLYGQFLTATATGEDHNTSEYSACVAYACDQIFGHGFDGATAQTCPAP